MVLMRAGPAGNKQALIAQAGKQYRLVRLSAQLTVESDTANTQDIKQK